MGFEELAAGLPEDTEENPPESAPKAKRRKGCGGNAIPGNLPKERLVRDVPEAERVCPKCGGEERSRQPIRRQWRSSPSPSPDRWFFTAFSFPSIIPFFRKKPVTSRQPWRCWGVKGMTWKPWGAQG